MTVAVIDTTVKIDWLELIHTVNAVLIAHAKK